jgi:hypothetical protein
MHTEEARRLVLRTTNATTPAAASSQRVSPPSQMPPPPAASQLRRASVPAVMSASASVIVNTPVASNTSSASSSGYSSMNGGNGPELFHHPAHSHAVSGGACRTSLYPHKEGASASTDNLNGLESEFHKVCFLTTTTLVACTVFCYEYRNMYFVFVLDYGRNVLFSAGKWWRR